MIIIGAGLSGLIAANYFRKKMPQVIESQAQLPNNHEALLRFRNDGVSKITGIPFEEVLVRKAIFANGMFADQPNIYLANQYSLKTNGAILSRSIWDTAPVRRYVAPKDFVYRLSQGVEIDYGKKLTAKEIADDAKQTPVISTIPMPIMMDMFDWKQRPKFNYQPIWAVAFDIIRPYCYTHQTIYFPELKDKRYRASITGDRFILELLEEPGDNIGDLVNETLETFGIPAGLTQCSTATFAAKHQPLGKILPIPEGARQEFIYWLTREHGIYSLGRFSTWRQLLLDDLVHDLQTIDRLIHVESSRALYSQALAATKQTRTAKLN